MKRLFTASALALVLALASGGAAQAALLPPEFISWNYNFAPGAPAVFADGDPTTVGSVSFTNEQGGNATGNSDIVATNLRVGSSANTSTPDRLDINGAYSLTLNLASNQAGHLYSGTLTFTGKLGGTFSAESANITNSFDSNSLQVLTLGNYIFTVSLPYFTPPGPPDQENAGSISAHVQVSGTSPNQVPEPSSIVLSALGVCFLGCRAALRRRKAVQQAA